MKRVMIGLVLMSVMVVGGLVGAKPFDLATAVTTGQATIADVAWLAGRWTGTAGSDSTDETCTAPARGVMTCMFRSMDGERITGLEFITLRETASGIEERVRFFSPDLAEGQGDNGITLRLTSVAGSQIVFDNVKESGVVKHETISRQGEDSFTVHIEVVDASGKSGFIDAQWKRSK
jgi:hypothetical protein